MADPVHSAAISSTPAPGGTARRRHRLYSNLAFYVLIAVCAGIAVGIAAPQAGVALRPLSRVFIRLIQMIISPVVFLALSSGIAHMGNLKRVGRIGLKALVYFEVLTTVALGLGLLVANVGQPGVGVKPPAATAAAHTAAVAPKPAAAAATPGWALWLNELTPDNFVGAFTRRDVLQVVVLALLFGSALIVLGPRAEKLVEGLDTLMAAAFAIIRIIMWTAPLGAFGAMAFTVGKYGLPAFMALARLVLWTWLGCAVYVVVVLGLVCRMFRVDMLRLLRYIWEEILIVIGTSSSESVLPELMRKLEAYGVARPVVGLVLPTGYSFNLDGLALSLPISVIFIAQVYGIHLSLGQQLGLAGILLLTSKGAAGVTGAAFATLAATVAAIGYLPMEGLALIVGVDAFLSLGRAVTNVIGNAVATVVVGQWEGEFHPGPGGAASSPGRAPDGGADPI